MRPVLCCLLLAATASLLPAQRPSSAQGVARAPGFDTAHAARSDRGREGAHEDSFRAPNQLHETLVANELAAFSAKVAKLGLPTTTLFQ